MNKYFKPYAALWGVLFVLFNVVAFVVPAPDGMAKYTASFFIGYVGVALAFAGQLACGYKAFSADSAQKMFYNLSLVRVAYIGLIAMFVVGGACMLVPALPYWVGVIGCAVVLAFTAVSVIMAQTAIDAVTHVDQKTAASTSNMRALTAAATEIITIAAPDVKPACQKVADALRYSDPVSNPDLAEEEAQIQTLLDTLQQAVARGKSVDEIVQSLLQAIQIRNQKCKLLK